MTIEQYTAYITSLMKQAEVDGFSYEIDMSDVRAVGQPLRKEDNQSDQDSR